MIVTLNENGTISMGGELFPAENKAPLGKGLVRLLDRDTHPTLVCYDKVGDEKYRLPLNHVGDYMLTLQEGTWLPTDEEADEIARAAASAKQAEQSRIAAARKQHGAGVGAFTYLRNNGYVTYLRAGETFVDTERAGHGAATWSSDGHVERTVDGDCIRVEITGATWAVYGRRISDIAVVWGSPDKSLFTELGAQTLDTQSEAAERRPGLFDLT